MDSNLIAPVVITTQVVRVSTWVETLAHVEIMRMEWASTIAME